jgi:AraC-like DNA-binding protein
MVQNKNGLLIFSGVTRLLSLVAALKSVSKNRETTLVTNFLAGSLFCLFLWAFDFGLKQIFTGYPSGIILYACLFVLFLFANQEFKRKEEKQEKEISPEIMAKIPEKSEKSHSQRPSPDMEQSLKFKRLLKEHFAASLAFRKPGYTIRDLANEMGIPVYLISSFINHEYGMNFNELVNAYRVEYLARVFKTSVDWESYTLEAVGKMAGFNSRTAFIAAIKKHTGMTPSIFFSRRESKKIEHSIFNLPEMVKEVA